MKHSTFPANTYFLIFSCRINPSLWVFPLSRTATFVDSSPCFSGSCGEHFLHLLRSSHKENLLCLCLGLSLKPEELLQPWPGDLPIRGTLHLCQNLVIIWEQMLTDRCWNLPSGQQDSLEGPWWHQVPVVDSAKWYISTDLDLTLPAPLVSLLGITFQRSTLDLLWESQNGAGLLNEPKEYSEDDDYGGANEVNGVNDGEYHLTYSVMPGT